MKNTLIKYLFIVSLFLPTLCKAEPGGDLNLINKAALVSRDGYALTLGTEGENDIVFVQDGTETFRIDNFGTATFTGLITATFNQPVVNGFLQFGTDAARIVSGTSSLVFRDSTNATNNFVILDESGDVRISRGSLIFDASASEIVPGATSLTFRNRADDAANLGITDAGAITIRNTLTSSRTTDLGWTAVNAANQACNTTCTSACVFGMNTGALGNFVGCADATADTCICAGAS